MSRLLVFGDLHCDRRHLRGLVERAVEERCDALVSLGDLCYLPRDPEGRRFLRSAGALLRRAGLELLLVDGNHDDAEALARAHARTPRPARCRSASACTTCRPEHASVLVGCAVSPTAARFPPGRVGPVVTGTGPSRASGPPSSASPRGGEIDLLFCHDPRTLEQGAQARGPFAALAAKLRPALVIYAHQHRPQVSAAGPPALVGLGSFRDGESSAVVLDSAETGRLVRALRDRQTAAQLEPRTPCCTPAPLGHGWAGSAARG